jgi:hypothetical protein
MFALNQSYRSSHYAQGNEIVLRFRFGQNSQNLACLLIESFDGGQDVSIRERLGLAENAFGAVLIDIESEDLPTKLGLHDDGAGCAYGGLGSALERKQAEGAKKGYE